MILHTLHLPDGLQWLDEYDLSGSVAAPMRRRLDGGLAVYPRALTAGRPITLAAPEDQPITRSQANALASLAAVPGATYWLKMPLRPGSPEYLVMFRYDESPLDLRPLIDYADPIDSDWIVGTIRLMTVI